MDDIVKDFLIESNENLDRLDQELVQLEADPQSKQLLASIFRTIHTIKGSCGFLGFARLEKVAHAGESLLSRLRDGELSLTAEVTSGLLAMVDAVRRMLGEIQATEHDGEQEYEELREQLKQLSAGATGAKTECSAPSPTPVADMPSSAARRSTSESENPRILQAEPPACATAPEPPATALPAAPNTPTPSSVAGGQYKPVPGKIGALLIERSNIRAEDLAAALQEQEHGDQRRIGEILVSMGFCRADDVQGAQELIEARGRQAGVETIRVGVTVLDKLMNLVGELVLTRNQLLQFASTSQDTGLHTISQRMNLIASELQEEVMRTRMQPIGNIWSKFPRTVRDLALACGKEVRIEMEGRETELDRTIIEAIKDPLTHLLRNSIDHGIESPERRTRAGKPPGGCVTLRAFHEGGQVNIEIADDGAGLNLDRIRKKAIERGLVTAEQAARMPEREIFNLIFLPGFSTAEKITNVSGRGVGMDVVRTNLEKIGGTVDLQSTAGQGTTVRIKIPLTLAIVPALIVRCSGERFAIPQISLTELVRLESNEQIEMVHGSPVHRLRGQLLPLVYLKKVLHPKSATTGDQQDRTAESVNIVVLQVAAQQFGLVVDDILDTEEIVVKPLARQLKGISAYSGSTIMGDGRIALILDIPGLAQRATVIVGAHEAAEAKKEAAAVAASAHGAQTLLLIQAGSDGRMAMPLSVVGRLEELPISIIEHSGMQEVMQYRGHVIPLVRLSRYLGCEPEQSVLADAERMHVVIYNEAGRTLGLIVDRIVDIVEESTKLESVANREGIYGTGVIQQRTTDLIDIPMIVRSAAPGYFEASAGQAEQ